MQQLKYSSLQCVSLTVGCVITRVTATKEQNVKKLLVILSLFIYCGLAGCSATQSTAKSEPANTVRIAAYNIEHFGMMFDQHDVPWNDRDKTEYYRDLEDIYEVARVIKMDNFDPDIICIEEGPTQKNLELFNKKDLDGKYEFVKVFDGNSTRGQTLCMMAKKGFNPIKIDQYYEEIDPADPAGKERLFSRGPAFVTFETPCGAKICVGVTHIKSKYGDNPEMVKFRSRQTARLGEICQGYMDSGIDYVTVMGDFNDYFGMDENETKAGLDAVAQVNVDKKDLKCLTYDLQMMGKNSYHCMLKPAKYRSFLDHAFASKKLADAVVDVQLFNPPIADVASDHWPIMVTYKLDK